MSYELNDLLNDSRLERLFSTESSSCALQLWVLQIKAEHNVENRIIYGRLLPYNFSNNTWSFSDKDTSQSFGALRASVTQLNLYIDSTNCRELLHKISEGQTIEEISEELSLKSPKKLNQRYGNTVLDNKNVIYRPVTYLLNRDAQIRNTLTSPHGSAGALSASITQSDKGNLLSIEEGYNTKFTEMVINRLNADTGMDFSGTDIQRIGDIELLIFPTLDENEKNLLMVDFNRNDGLKIQLTSSQLSQFESFQFRLSIENNSQILHSSIAEATKNQDGQFTYTFKLSEKLFNSTDSTYLEIFGFQPSPHLEGYLCSRYKIGYIREMNFNINVVDNKSNSVKFDWLEKTTPSTKSDRVVKALAPTFQNQTSNNQIGGREVDSWVPVNRQLESLFKKLNPKKSDGRFFPRNSESSGEGRLQFVEWFKGIMDKHQQQHITIFDPYFEDAGLNLLTLYVSPMADYTVFRTIPKPKDVGKPNRRKSDNIVGTGINNLIANCNHNRSKLHHSKLRIYGLKEGSLHDRYILINGQNGLPIEGFHLSNSFQKAAENYPLLITPIPTDVLYKVNQYAFDLIQKENTVGNESSCDSISLLFDSKSVPKESILYEPLSILNNKLAGNVLGVWLDQSILKGQAGNDLKNKMSESGTLENDSLHQLEKGGLFNCLGEMDGELGNFTEAWNIIGDILAHSPVGDDNLKGLKNETKFLAFLSDFLSSSFQRETIDNETDISVIDSSYFKSTFKDCLHSGISLHHFQSMVKHKCLTWAEFYTIKFLWCHAPEVLLEHIDREVNWLNEEFSPSETIRLSFLGQIINEISIDYQFNNITDSQRQALLRSNNNFVKWISWNVVEQQLKASSSRTAMFKLISTFSPNEQIQFYGWALNRISKEQKNSELCEKLKTELHQSLPQRLLNDDLELLIDSMRGHMNQLGWMELWQFNDIINPLLTNSRANCDDACKIWIEDLLDSLDKKNRGNSLLFTSDCEGKTTNICAYLLAHSSSVQQDMSLQLIGKTLNKQRQIIQQPLASTTNWSKWNDALKISLWILAFTKWYEYYLNNLGIESHCKLNNLAKEARNLSMFRSRSEWDTEKDLLSFIEEVDKLQEEKTTS
ncbi:VPA1262 family protein [Pseudocolwellia sp. HL-MZ19]|uniref:VPA1262 family protein n=1 Tax=Pseudocolwellia sp. HL-MZ19 TaxID=3400846 RepID=UPI003CEFD749